MRLLIAIIVFLLFSVQASAQREMANWYFGNNAGLDFNGGIGIPQNDSGISTIETCGITSDANGNLLFYSDGETVFTRTHEVMPNGQGILGHKSSTNGGIVIPFPGDPSRYYLFTADAVQHYQETGGASGRGLNYAIIRMTDNGGLGAVEDKNITLLENSSEKLTAVAKSDGSGFWILTHYQDTFYAYSITSAGIAPAETTTIGPLIDSFQNYRGSLKFSPDGTKVAIAHSKFEPVFGGDLFLYDFDETTGTLSNEISLGDDLIYYGVEFSANSERLYSSSKIPLDGGNATGDILIDQFDILSANIPGSRYTIAQFPGNPLRDLPGALQVAIDTKIYYANSGDLISIINRPNRDNDESDFQFKAQDLALGFSSFGLPSGIQSYYDNIIEFDNLCLDEATEFNLNTQRGISSVVWNFGDIQSGPNNTSTTQNPLHTFSGAGVYTVTAEVTFVDGETKVYQVIVRVLFSFDGLEFTLTACDTDGVDDGISIFDIDIALLFLSDVDQANDLSVQASYFLTLQDAINFENPILNNTEYENLFSGQVIYARTFQSVDCIGVARITLEVVLPDTLDDISFEVCASFFTDTDVSVPVLSLTTALEMDYPGFDFLFYRNLEDVMLDVPINGANILLPLDGDFSLYYRLQSETTCFGVGKITLDITEPLDLDEEINVPLCSFEEGVVLSPPGDYASYMWSTGETTPSITVFNELTYEVVVTTNSGCFAVINYIVALGTTFEIAVVVNDFQQNNSIVIDNGTTDGSLIYSIDGGLTFQDSPVFENLAAGYYQVVVMGGDGCNTINELVLVRGAPRYFTPNSDGIHDFWHVNQSESYQGMEVKIFDRFGKLLYEMDHTDRGWDGTYNGVLMPTNGYWYQIAYEGAEYYGHFTLIRRRL